VLTWQAALDRQQQAVIGEQAISARRAVLSRQRSARNNQQAALGAQGNN